MTYQIIPYLLFRQNIRNTHHFFFDRGNEYGRSHIYLEALCHALPLREKVVTSSARYFNRVKNQAYEAFHFPATIHLCAFIETFRNINSDFIAALKTSLTSYRNQIAQYPEAKQISESAVEEFVNGAFRNLAIQIHCGAPSHSRDVLYHMDHVFSALHMAVTLHGERTIGFRIPENEFALLMREGDVYVTTPAGILHGISVDKLGTSDRSVAVQCRTLLSGEATSAWAPHSGKLCLLVTELLEKFTLRMPTYEEWLVQFQKMESELKNPEEKMVEFKNTDE